VVVISAPGQAASVQVSVASSAATLSTFKGTTLRSGGGGQPLPLTYTALYLYNITRRCGSKLLCYPPRVQGAAPA
jgi:hypothetical protein